MHLSTRVLVYILAAFGACVTTFDMVVLGKTSTQSTPYHEWLFRCSRFPVSVIILLVSRCGSWLDVLSNGMLCFWWIAKLALLIPQLQIVLSSPGVLKWTMEICGVLIDTVFGILINIIRVKAATYESSLIMEPLLPYQMEIEEDNFRDL